MLTGHVVGVATSVDVVVMSGLASLYSPRYVL